VDVRRNTATVPHVAGRQRVRRMPVLAFEKASAEHYVALAAAMPWIVRSVSRPSESVLSS